MTFPPKADDHLLGAERARCVAGEVFPAVVPDSRGERRSRAFGREPEGTVGLGVSAAGVGMLREVMASTFQPPFPSKQSGGRLVLAVYDARRSAIVRVIDAEEVDV